MQGPTRQRTWDPHTDLLARFAEAGASPLASSGSTYVRMCCTSPCHGLAPEYVEMWRTLYATALAEAGRGRGAFDVGPVIDAFRRRASEARREAGDAEYDRFGDSKADRSMTMVLYTGARAGGGTRPEAGLHCWSRACATEDMLAGAGVPAKSYLYASEDWYRPENVVPLGPVPRVALRNDLEGDLFLRPPDVTLAQFAELKRLPVSYLKRFAADDEQHGGLKFFYHAAGGGETWVGTKKRLYLQGKNNFLWYGKTLGNGKRMPITAYHEREVAAGRLAGRFDSNVLVVVEGESDWLTLNFHNVHTLALPGASTAETLLPRHLEGVTTVYVSRENDRGAGDGFVRGVASRLVALGYDGAARSLAMPDGFKDPSDLHVEDPRAFPERFRAALAAAPLVDLGRVAAEMAEEAAARNATRQGTARAAHPSSSGSARVGPASPRAGWLSEEGVTLAERGRRATGVPLSGASEDARADAAASRERAASAAVALLEREADRIDPSKTQSRVAAREFAHRAVAWAARQTSAEFWTDIADRPERLVVAAIERDRDLRMFAAEARVEIPLVRRALDLAVLEGRPSRVEWAYSLRWEAFARLERHIRAREEAVPEVAQGVRDVGELVKQALRKQGQAEFWINTRFAAPEDFVEHAAASSPLVADARARLVEAHARRSTGVAGRAEARGEGGGMTLG